MKNIETINQFKVKELSDNWGKALEIEIIAGRGGTGRNITSERAQKPGLRMIDSDILLDEGAIQVLGRTEISYFEKLSGDEKKNITNRLSSQNVACFIVSRDLSPDPMLKKACTRKKIPLFSTKLYTGKLISLLNDILEVRLAPFATAHGVLMDIHRLGVLILGKSGIGKSECALDLINRGSKLISDDVVEIRKVGASKLVGNGPEKIKHLMEIRGVGIININHLFGTASVMEKREIDMVIELVPWDSDTEYDRVGLDEKTYDILGVDIPYLLIPVRTGRNTATIIEVAARNQLLKKSGSEERENQFDILMSRKNNE